VRTAHCKTRHYVHRTIKVGQKWHGTGSERGSFQPGGKEGPLENYGLHGRHGKVNGILTVMGL
jgi:hypothetical protein